MPTKRAHFFTVTKEQNGAVLWWDDISVAVELDGELAFQQKKLLFTLLLSWMNVYIHSLQGLLEKQVDVWFFSVEI